MTCHPAPGDRFLRVCRQGWCSSILPALADELVSATRPVLCPLPAAFLPNDPSRGPDADELDPDLFDQFAFNSQAVIDRGQR